MSLPGQPKHARPVVYTVPALPSFRQGGAATVTEAGAAVFCPPHARLIALRRGGFAIVDEADYPALSPYTWGSDGNGYPLATVAGRQVFMHRFLMSAPKGSRVDHINGNPRDNRRANLRFCTATGNSRNQRKTHGRSVFKGVYRSRNMWAASIKVEDRTIHLGRFDDEAAAALAYDEAAVHYHGRFARTNLDGLLLWLESYRAAQKARGLSNAS